MWLKILLKWIILPYCLIPVDGMVFALNQPPKTTPGEQAAYSIVKAFTNIAGAAITKTTCKDVAFSYPFKISTSITGAGQGILNGTIIIKSESKYANIVFGYKYELTQTGQGFLIDNLIQEYYGEFYFSANGESLFSQSTFKQNQFGVLSPWNAESINDFWAVFGTYGKLYNNYGIETISRSDLPQSKWRENSQFIRPSTTDGYWSTTKSLVSTDNSIQCTISLRGKYNLLFGGVHNFSGVLTITPF